MRCCPQQPPCLRVFSMRSGCRGPPARGPHFVLRTSLRPRQDGKTRCDPPQNRVLPAKTEFLAWLYPLQFSCVGTRLQRLRPAPGLARGVDRAQRRAALQRVRGRLRAARSASDPEASRALQLGALRGMRPQGDRRPQARAEAIRLLSRVPPPSAREAAARRQGAAARSRPGASLPGLRRATDRAQARRSLLLDRLPGLGAPLPRPPHSLAGGSPQRCGRYSPSWKTRGSPGAVSSSRTSPVRIT